MTYRTVLFDLDGTLTDPKEGITKSVQYALSRFDIIESNLDVLEPFIGPPLQHSFTEMYHFSASDANKAIAYYREYFEEKGMYENIPYEGIDTLLELLQQQQRVVMVATSKPRVFAKRILEHFRMDHYFDYIGGSHLDGTLVDKTELIAAIMKENEVERQGTVMIGDRKYDLIGASNNRIDSIGVAYGYGSRQELMACEPTHYVKSVQELMEFFHHH